MGLQVDDRLSLWHEFVPDLDGYLLDVSVHESHLLRQLLCLSQLDLEFIDFSLSL